MFTIVSSQSQWTIAYIIHSCRSDLYNDHFHFLFFFIFITYIKIYVNKTGSLSLSLFACFKYLLLLYIAHTDRCEHTKNSRHAKTWPHAAPSLLGWSGLVSSSEQVKQLDVNGVFLFLSLFVVLIYSVLHFIILLFEAR